MSGISASVGIAPDSARSVTRTTTSVGRHRDVDVERDVVAALAAVLDGVHGGLADRRLQPLQAVRRQAEVGHGGGHAVHRLALVARERRAD